MNKKVTIIWRNLPDYRVAFYQQLREDLLRRHIELNLIYGPTNGNGLNGAGQSALPWAKCVDHWSATIRGIELCWQPYSRYIRDADLIILEQANRLLLNYWLIAKRSFSRQKIAFWGHGRDLQTGPNTIRNAWKQLFIKYVDWWFAYTAEVKENLINHAFPAERITNVQNAIDTEILLRTKAAIPAQRLDAIRNKLRLGSGPIGIYCGRMYREKRIEFLLETCRQVRDRVPNFEVILIGGGEEQDKVRLAADSWDWLHYVGPKYGQERVPYFLMANVFLMPGLVGLAILDSFALEVPLVTTNFPYHSPEVAYLRSNENGLITNDNVDDYVAAVCGLISEPERMAKLKSGCRDAASIYTMEAMVDNFADGIAACLEMEVIGSFRRSVTNTN